MWGLAVIAVAFLALLPSTVQMWRQSPGCRPIIYFLPLYAGIFLACRTPLFFLVLNSIQVGILFAGYLPNLVDFRKSRDDLAYATKTTGGNGGPCGLYGLSGCSKDGR